MTGSDDPPGEDPTPHERPVLRLAGPRRTSALGLAMLGLDEAMHGPLDREVVVVSDDAGAPPDGKVRVVLGSDPQSSTIVISRSSSDGPPGEK